MSKDIERVMEELRPLRQWDQPGNAMGTPMWTNQKQAEAYLRKYIATTLREIAAPRPAAGQIKEKADKLAKNLRRVQDAAKELPDNALSLIGADEKFIADLERVRRASAQFSAKIRVKKTSGSVADGDRMLLAAARARDLMVSWTEKKVRLTKRGDYLNLTALLYEIATGKKRDPEKACDKHLHKIWGSLTAKGEPDPPDWLSSR